MTDWRVVNGSQETEPQEFDTETSGVIVYQRRNIERITTENLDGTSTELWQYEEREMTREEYAVVRAEVQQNQIDQIRADVDYLSAMSEIEL